MTAKTETPADHLADLKAGAEGVQDLASLDTRAMAAVACELLHPATKAPTGQKVWLNHKDSPKVQSYLNDKANTQLRLEAARAARNKQPEAPTVEKGTERVIDMLCCATDHWEGVFFNGERNADFTVAKGRELYAIPWVREQLVEFMGEVENFMKG